MRERVTISIKKDVLTKIDKKIDGLKIRNRSHAIESLVSEALGIDSINDVIILAGGKEAIKSITAIKDALLRVKKIGVKEVVVATGYLGDKIRNELKSGEDFGIKINYFDKGQGTGGAILPFKNALKKTFLVINLDQRLETDYKMLIDFHKASDSIGTIATNDIQKIKGVYILEPEIFEYIPKGFSMLEEDIFPKLLKNHKLTIYPVF